MTKIEPEDLPLQRAYHWEKARANEIFLTQPMGEGVVRDWTWAQAMHEARCMATWLKTQGWEPGSRIALMSKNTAWWIMSDLAIWMAGYVTVPIYPNLVADTVRAILTHSECRLCIVGKLDDWDAMRLGIPDGMPCVSTPLCDADHFTTWESIVANNAPMTENPTFPEGTLATIIYTSGTTGMPKGAMHNFGAFAHTAKAINEIHFFRTSDRLLSYLPLAHIVERSVIEIPGITAGLRIFFAESLDTFLADLKRARPTLFVSVPRLWVKFQQGVFAKIPPQKLNRLMSIPLLGRLIKRKILRQLGLDAVSFAGSGSAPLPPDVLRWYRNLGLNLLEAYGMSENLVTHCNRPGHERIGYVGHVTACCECKLSDIGEVLTRGPTHMLGYYREPEKTLECYTDDGWFKTGDLGEIDEEGRLRLVGRLKEQFKTSKGKYVAPAPIEGKLGAFTGIEAVMVTGAAFAQPFAMVMLPIGHWEALQSREKRQVFDAALKAHLENVNAQLDPHERLDFISVVPEQWNIESGFITPTLKLKRNEIDRYYARHFENWSMSRQSIVWHEGGGAE